MARSLALIEFQPGCRCFDKTHVNHQNQTGNIKNINPQRYWNLKFMLSALSFFQVEQSSLQLKSNLGWKIWKPKFVDWKAPFFFQKKLRTEQSSLECKKFLDRRNCNPKVVDWRAYFFRKRPWGCTPQSDAEKFSGLEILKTKSCGLEGPFQNKIHGLNSPVLSV